jgi:dTDP-4-amino-4,6-dideoxygalactose transaminase
VNVPFLDLRRETEELRPELDRAIAGVLDSGSYILGPAVAAFEEAFAAYCGSRHAVGVASGTDAITLALRAFEIGPGDEVVTAANTCVPTVAAIEATGATPVLVDADARRWTIDPAAFDAAIGPRTRAVVPVHLYGRCADVDALREVAQRHGLKIVEDAAQAHGADLDGRRAGTLGDAAAFSFYPTKNLGGLGDGGAVVTDDTEIAERVRMLSTYGERERYRAELHGTNSRLDPVQAAVLSVKLGHLDRWNARRRALAARYRAELAGVVGLPEATAGSAEHLFVVRVRERDAFRTALAHIGVETLVHYPLAVHQQPAYAALANGQLAVAEELCSEVVSLPLYAHLRDEEAAAVIQAVRRAA